MEALDASMILTDDDAGTRVVPDESDGVVIPSTTGNSSNSTNSSVKEFIEIVEEASETSSFWLIFTLFFVVCLVGSAYQGYKYLTGVGRTPPPLLSETELNGEDTALWMGVGGGARQMVSSQSPFTQF